MNQILKIIDQIEEKNSKTEKDLKIFLLKNLEKINSRKEDLKIKILLFKFLFFENYLNFQLIIGKNVATMNDKNNND